MSDELAQQLANLEVKRNRTLADLETVQAAVESVKRSMSGFHRKQDEVVNGYIDQLAGDELVEKERQEVYRAWNSFMKQGFEKYENLANERERLHVQELILVRMVAELDARIKTLREQMG